MAYYVVVGLGRFGHYLSLTLAERGADVVVIDKDVNAVEAIKDRVFQAVIGDGTSRNVLENLGVANAEAVVVALGPKMEESLLTVHNLKEIGVKRIVAKANSDAHGKILEALGADEIVFAEKETAVRVGHRLGNRNLLDFLPLNDRYSIREIVVPEHFIGKSLRELDLRSRFEVNVIAIKRMEEILFPGGESLLNSNDHLVVLGSEKALNRLTPQE
ncbi:MAG TPA: TrkA family potassium uptake protein [Candidatus Aminicenantes bacterium]|nr:TrkA family potassium uptake protein [Candidatus Aminicenantes bacterium]HPS98994.1 TrkA family potassium uptake protein [Candidatus Aminicenantes bacterium]